MDCSIFNSVLKKHIVICQRKKASYFSAFHWSPHGSLVFIGQHFVTTRVVHILKKTKNKPNYRIGSKRTKSPNRTGCAGLAEM